MVKAALRRDPEPPCTHDGGRTWMCKTFEHADTCTGMVLRVPYTVETCNRCGAELASWARDPFESVAVPFTGPQPEEGRDAG